MTSPSEAATRLADAADPVPDVVWDEAVSQYDERTPAGLLAKIAIINAFNRLSVPIHQSAVGRSAP